MRHSPLDPEQEAVAAGAVVASVVAES